MRRAGRGLQGQEAARCPRSPAAQVPRAGETPLRRLPAPRMGVAVRGLSGARPQEQLLLSKAPLCLVLHYVHDLRTSGLDLINPGGNRNPAKPEAYYSQKLIFKYTILA